MTLASRFQSWRYEVYEVHTHANTISIASFLRQSLLRHPSVSVVARFGSILVKTQFPPRPISFMVAARNTFLTFPTLSSPSAKMTTQERGQKRRPPWKDERDTTVRLPATQK